MNKEEILKRMGKAIVEGNKDEAEALANEAIKQRLDLNDVIDKGYVPGIEKVGEL